MLSTAIACSDTIAPHNPGLSRSCDPSPDTDHPNHTLLTSICQTQEVRPGDLSGLTMTSSLSTGRALEKARFFSAPFRK
jgi:hypothetical protein